MNGVRQRARRSQTQQAFADLDRILTELDSRIVELARVVQVLDERTVELGNGTAEAYNALSQTVDRLQVPVALLAGRDAVRAASLWARLRWIVRGS